MKKIISIRCRSEKNGKNGDIDENFNAYLIKSINAFRKIVLLTLFIFACTVNGSSFAADTKDMVESSYPPYHAPKKRIAVTGFDNKAGGVSSNMIGDAMAEMLTTELVKSGHFVVLERMALKEVLGEQGIGAQKIVTPESAAKIGNVLGAQILVKGVVSEFTEKASGTGASLGVGPFKFGGGSSYALVAVDIRLIDATTGEVLQSHNATGKAPSSDVALGVTTGAVDFNTDSFRNAPIGHATRQAINEAIKFIISSMEKIPFSAKVVKIEDEDVYMNAGFSMNIKKGDKFQVYAVGESVIDPDTGLSLGSKDKHIGTVEVKEVADKFSIGVSQSSTPLKPGYILRLE